MAIHSPPSASRTSADAHLPPTARKLRAEQVGSLLRPPKLLSGRRVWLEGRLQLEGLRTLEDQAIVEVLEEQHRIGLDVVSDGQFRRSSWLGDMADAVDGFVTATRGRPFDPRAEDDTRPNVVGDRLRPHSRLTVREADFLAEHARAPFKITWPSPTSLAFASYEPGTTDVAYPTWAELFDDLAAIIRTELDHLVAEGTSYLQLDAPGYTLFADPAFRESCHEGGVDPDTLLAQAIEADNHCVAGLPRDQVSVAVHLCRGSAPQHWLASGVYESMAEKLFGQLDFDIFLVECEREWAGGFRALRHLPDDKRAVLGLVPSSRVRSSSYSQLLARIEAAAEHHPLERLAVSPQCGFASASFHRDMSFDDQRRKLELVRRLADDVWF